MSEQVMEMIMDQTPKRDGRRNYASKEQLEATRAAFVEWVQHILDQKGWTPTDLANNSDLAPSTILRIMNSKNHPFAISFMTIRKVAEGSGYPVPRALMEAHGIGEHSQPKDLEVKPRPERLKAIHRSEVESMKATSALPAAMTMPLRHISSLPAAIAPKVADTTTERPSSMNGDETAFAVMMPDDGLQPVLKSGSILYATKRRDPAQGDVVVVFDKSGRGRVRVVEAIDEDGIHLERLFPERKPEVIAFDDIEEFGVVEGMWRR